MPRAAAAAFLRRHPDMSMQMWGGLECTVNRVGNDWFDQVVRSGHVHRVDDLDRFASLGITHLRYPVLWERVAPNGMAEADWAWTDERLGRLRDLGIVPIVGLVHHGSGPPHTSLVDPAFVDGLAGFAAAVAQRYPWLQHFTPVNEPLTTARFSGLYGLWYPHGRDDRTFVRALLGQCLATRVAMARIREAIPAARLVQTEDIGYTYATTVLAAQARFENERRWLSLDLLCGRVSCTHPMRDYLVRNGATDQELETLEVDPCPPDIIGINHYVTSERWLDERRQRYPACTYGGNRRRRYADVEAVRVREADLGGAGVALLEAWERYRRPLAITEAHLGGTRDEQMRWLHEVWQAAQDAGTRGADVRAVTVWSLLGAFDWNSLVTRDAGHYESGVFDVRGPSPRPTALAGVVRQLASGVRCDHPVLDTPGWWHRPLRLLYPPVPAMRRDGARPAPALPTMAAHPREVLVLGRGTLGQAVGRMCELRGMPYRLLSRADLDITDATGVQAVLAAVRPWAVVNAAGYADIDEAEQNADACHRCNVIGPSVLAAACAERGLPLMTFSSALVFDGATGAPYLEWQPRAPLSVYGASHAAAEDAVLDVYPGALVLRTSACFSPWDASGFVHDAVRTLNQGRAFRAATDVRLSPTYVPDLVMAGLDLLIDGEHGVWHLANEGDVSWAELAHQVARAASVDARQIAGVPIETLRLPARRPPYSVLGSERGRLLPSLDDALARWARECA